MPQFNISPNDCCFMIEPSIDITNSATNGVDLSRADVQGLQSSVAGGGQLEFDGSCASVEGSSGFDLGGFHSVWSGYLGFEFAVREILAQQALASFGGAQAQTSWVESFGTTLFLGVLSCGCQG